jgi:predicted CoA-binding protein
MTTLESIQSFLSQEKVAVAGVSRKKQKFGNAIYNELAKKGFQVYPVNPHIDDFQGQKCYHAIADLPEDVSALVINTRNETTLQLVDEAKQKGIKNIWLQQGSIHRKELEKFDDKELNIVSSQCIFMHVPDAKGIHAFHRWIKKSFGTFPS